MINEEIDSIGEKRADEGDSGKENHGKYMKIKYLNCKRFCMRIESNRVNDVVTKGAQYGTVLARK